MTSDFLRLIAKWEHTKDSLAGTLGYMTTLYVCVSSRCEDTDWYFATDEERRFFLLFVAYDLETFWETHRDFI